MQLCLCDHVRSRHRKGGCDDCPCPRFARATASTRGGMPMGYQPNRNRRRNVPPSV